MILVAEDKTNLQSSDQCKTQSISIMNVQTPLSQFPCNHLSTPCNIAAFDASPVGRRRNNSKRRVEFQARVQVYRATRIPEEELSNIFYGSETKLGAKADAHAIMQQQENTEDSFVSAYREALSISASKDGKLDHLISSITKESPARGLELTLFPEAVKARRMTIRKIIRAQKNLPGNLNADEKRFLLRELSLRLTRPSRRMAEFRAVGDAMQVVKMLRNPAKTC